MRSRISVSFIAKRQFSNQNVLVLDTIFTFALNGTNLQMQDRQARTCSRVRYTRGEWPWPRLERPRVCVVEPLCNNFPLSQLLVCGQRTVVGTRRTCGPAVLMLNYFNRGLGESSG